MEHTDFLTHHVKIGTQFIAGLLSVDIAGHSRLNGTEWDKAATKTALEGLISSQIRDEAATLLPWHGDGGVLLFDLKEGGNAMLLFADRLRHIIPMFNRARGTYNQLPHRQEVILTIVCHAGELLNKSGDAGQLSGHAFDMLAKHSRTVARPGYVTLTSEVHARLSTDLQSRCTSIQHHADFGSVYALDPHDALVTLKYADSESTGLKTWIEQSIKHRQYDRLLYFSYTNELLYDFLGYQLDGIEVRILARNWVVEREEETQANNEASATGEDGLAKRRPWAKADIISVRAKEIAEHARGIGSAVDMMFYDQAPLFNGAILVSEKGPPLAFVGISKWEETPETGGSPYKLEAWPALLLDGRDHVQLHMIEYLASRFDELWKKGKSYEEVLQRDAHERALNRDEVNKIWDLGGEPYPIVYPHRKVPERSFPVVALEDVMAVRAFERLCTTFDLRHKLQSFEVPIATFDPIDAEIDAWAGHVIYVCTKSLGPALWHHLEALAFPYRHVLGPQTPAFVHATRRELVLTSPTDAAPPEARDYGLIAKFPRARGRGYGYIAAGVRAMGTWGAAEYFANRANMHVLGDLVGDRGFVAVVETRFDPVASRVDSTRLYITPETFG